MRFLALFFLAVFAVAAAVPLPYANHDMGRVVAVEDFFEDLAVENDKEVKTEIGKLLKDYLNKLVEKVKDAVEQGKVVKEDTLIELREVRQKLRDLKIDIGNRAKVHLEELKEKAKGYWNQILDVLEGKNDNDWEPQTEIGKQLKKEFDDILEKFKDAVEKGKAVKEDTLEKLKEIRQKLSDMKGDISDNAKKVIRNLREKAKDYFHRFLEKLRPSRSLHSEEYLAYADDDMTTYAGEIIKDYLNDLLEELKDAVEQGKVVKEDTLNKLRELRQILRDLKVDIGNRARERLDELKEKAKGYWNQILDVLEGKSDKDWETQTEIGKRLKKEFDDVLEKFKNAVEKGKAIKDQTLENLKDIRQKLRDIKGDISDNAKKIIKNLREKAKDYFHRLLERFRPSRSLDSADFLSPVDVAAAEIKVKEIFKRLRDLIKSKIDKEALKEKVEKLFGKGSELAEQLINLLKEKGEKGKKKVLDWIDRVLGDEEEKRSIKEVYDKVRNYFRDLNIELKEKFAKFGEYVKEKYEQGLERGKTRVENLKRIAKKFLEDTREMSRDVANEALEFFREYKDDLGRVFEEIREKVKVVVNKED